MSNVALHEKAQTSLRTLTMSEKKIEFGGSLLKGRRKSERPLRFDRTIHIVLKANDVISLLLYDDAIKGVINKYGDKFAVAIENLAVHEDHIHLAVCVPSRAQYNNWARAITGRIAQLIPALKWKLRPYNRVALCEDGRVRLLNYIEKNRSEANFIKSAHARIQSCRKFCQHLLVNVS
jgi:REP element-mobilizing transposase RayT